MPQLQIVNTGASPLNTALGEISAGFIENFNKRAEEAKNDEIFSRIKSKYGPEADADTLYKDILQSQGFDQSYKKDLLGMISQYSTLQKAKKRTAYEEGILAIREKDLGIKNRKVTEDINQKNRFQFENVSLKKKIHEDTIKSKQKEHEDTLRYKYKVSEETLKTRREINDANNKLKEKIDENNAKLKTNINKDNIDNRNKINEENRKLKEKINDNNNKLKKVINEETLKSKEKTSELTNQSKEKINAETLKNRIKINEDRIKFRHYEKEDELDYKRKKHEDELNLKKQELELKTKKADEPLTKYQQELVQHRQRQLDIQEAKIKAAVAKNDKDLPNQVAKYTKTYFTGTGDIDKVSPAEKAEIDSNVTKLVQDGAPLNEAFAQALAYQEEKNSIIDAARAPEKPTAYIGEADPNEIEQGLNQLYSYLKQMYDAGITNQRDLRKIAKGNSNYSTGWSNDQINRTLARIYHKKPRENVQNNSNQTKSKEALTNILLGK